MMYQNINDGIYRIIIPFEDIYTSAFILMEKGATVIFDSGTSASDAENYIIPAVSALGVNVKYIATSHSHSDHAGGRFRLIEEYPEAERADFFESSLFKDGDVLLGRFELINLKGHTKDGMAIYDLKTKTLLTADDLQQKGIGKYRNGISDRVEYLKDIEKIKALLPEVLIASHDYDPLGYIAKGKDEIDKLLSLCLSSL